MTVFSGCLTAMITPFKGRHLDEVNYDAIEKLVEIQSKSGVSAIVPCGTTGESPTLSHHEHVNVIKAAVAASKDTDLKVIAGTGSNSTKEALELTSRAAELGVDGVLVVVPYYNKPTPLGLLKHFQELDKIGVPIIVYNIPSRTGINLSPETISTIFDRCTNVVGLKASSGNLDEITEISKITKDSKFSILSGDDSLTLPILSVGGGGVISVIANIMPKVMSKLVSSYCLEANTSLSRDIMLVIHKLSRSLLSKGSNPEAVKYLLTEFVLEVGGCRLPLDGLDEESKSQIKDILSSTCKELFAIGVEVDNHLADVMV